MHRLSVFFLFTWTVFTTCFAQKNVTLYGQIRDEADRTTLPSATITLTGQHTTAVFADKDGHYKVSVRNGEEYKLTVRFVGYKPYHQDIRISQDTRLDISMKSDLRLSEVVVTAKEGQGPVTTSVIGRDAMNHLQPNSIADLMELLPGGYSKDPDMGRANTMQLRETGTLGAYGSAVSNNHYAISSLGTQFIVDGAPIITDANLQYSPLGNTQSSGSGTSAEDSRNITNKGVDMRSIGTDDIEKVEVMRGIPGAEYGNLTSGIVRIHKIRRAVPLTMRFKADGYSKLVAAGKGIGWGDGQNNILNLDLGFLDSKTDPTNNLENYKRLNASLRYTLKNRPKDREKHRSWQFNSAIDYTGSFDNSKQDPDLNFGRIDEYKSSLNRMALTNSFRLTRQRSIWRELEINTSVSLQLDRLHQRRVVAPQRYAIVPTNYDEGENEAKALYAEYNTDYLCDGKPFYVYVMAKGVAEMNIGKKIVNQVKYGLNWDYSKNFGRGQVYDLNYPLSTTGWSSRPRQYSDIPALQNLSFFVEESVDAKIGGSEVRAIAGLRLNTMPRLDRRYKMQGRWYADPRINVNWRLPYLTIAGKPMKTAINVGWGKTTKNPTQNYLYPDKYYSNFIELAYYDTQNPSQDSRFVVQTYVQDPTNHNITPARNHKWEIRLDMEWGNNALSIDYFRENMTDGFRYSRTYGSYQYKKYDASHMAPGTDWRGLPFTMMQVLDGYQYAGNGSKIDKQGVELQFSSARIPLVRTRVIVSGAWFRTTYTNSQPMYETVNSVVGGQAISDWYVGLYDWNDGRINDRLNTNFTFDTQIPEWGLIFTTSMQWMWRIKTKRQWQNGYPVAYLSAADGQLHPYTKDSESDAILQHLVKTYNESSFQPFTIPKSMILNLKATKQIGHYLKLSFFANKILDYMPDYKSNGNVIRRNASPYFGMEANVKI